MSLLKKAFKQKNNSVTLSDNHVEGFCARLGASYKTTTTADTQNCTVPVSSKDSFEEDESEYYAEPQVIQGVKPRVKRDDSKQGVTIDGSGKSEKFVFYPPVVSSKDSFEEDESEYYAEPQVIQGVKPRVKRDDSKQGVTIDGSGKSEKFVFYPPVVSSNDSFEEDESEYYAEPQVIQGVKPRVKRDDSKQGVTIVGSGKSEKFVLYTTQKSSHSSKRQSTRAISTLNAAPPQYSETRVGSDYRQRSAMRPFATAEHEKIQRSWSVSNSSSYRNSTNFEHRRHSIDNGDIPGRDYCQHTPRNLTDCGANRPTPPRSSASTNAINSMSTSYMGKSYASNVRGTVGSIGVSRRQMKSYEFHRNNFTTLCRNSL